MPEAQEVGKANARRSNAVGIVQGGDIHQLADGRAAYVDRTTPAVDGDPLVLNDVGQIIVPKATGIALLNGGDVFWDHSARLATYRPVNDRDFFLGTAVGDSTSTSVSCVVNFNVGQSNKIDLISKDPALSVATGTPAAGGFGLPARYGAAIGMQLTATSEAQCVDVFSVDRFSIDSNPIVEAVVRIAANGSTNAVDLNIGLANNTSTTDADAITESVFFHIDGGSLDILAESDDGTTEVNATDTTIDATAGTAVANRLEFWIDCRNPADVQMYVNGVNVLSSTVFKLNAATGPLGLLAHLEKSTGTATAGPVYLDKFRVRTMEN
jgi:hypothetical protein